MAEYKEISIFSKGDPGSFAYDPDNPTKYTEALSFELSKNLFAANQAGMVWSQGIDPEIIRIVKEGLQALLEYNTALKNAYDKAQSTRSLNERGLPAVILPFLPLVLRAGVMLARIWAVVRFINWEMVAIEATFQIVRWLIERQYTLPSPGAGTDITTLITKIDELFGNMDAEGFDKDAVPYQVLAALQDLVLKDSSVRLGDNCEFHQRSELLEY
jgi:hypothetical protein